jgi:hypothetical protein
MSIETIVEMDVDHLRVLAADGGGTCNKIGPFAAHHDEPIAEFHLRVTQIAARVGDYHRTLEAESLFQPIEGSEWMLVEHRGGESGTSISVCHAHIPPSP